MDPADEIYKSCDSEPSSSWSGPSCAPKVILSFNEAEELEAGHRQTTDPQLRFAEPMTTTELGMESKLFTTAEPLLKIEVIHGKELTRSITVFFACFLFSAVFAIVYIVLANTVWFEAASFGGNEYTYIVAPYEFDLFTTIAESILACMLFVTSTLYMIAVLRVPRSARTLEMAFVLVLGFCTSFLLIPLFQDGFLQVSNTYSISFEAFLALLTATSLASGVLGSGGISLFVWSMAISLRREPETGLGKFYYVRMIFLFLHLLIRGLLGGFSKIFFSWIPFLSFGVGLGKINRSGTGLGPSQLFALIANLVMETLMILVIALEMGLLKSYVDKLDYLERRTTRIAAMQFRYYTVATFLYTIIVTTVCMFATDNDLILLSTKFWGYTFFQAQYGQLAYALIIPAYVMIQLYFLLPARAPPFYKALRCRCELQEKDLSEEQFSHRFLERPDDPTFNRRSFVSETCAIMINLSWLPATYGSKMKAPLEPIVRLPKVIPKVVRFKIDRDRDHRRLRQDFNDDRFRITKYVKNEETDTHSLIFEAVDRIVVTFKGTKSLKNLATDLNVDFLPATALSVPSHRNFNAISGPLAVFQRKPLVHAGFLLAYTSVREQILDEIDRLIERDRRPVFFGGHSLGGALATLCSFDVKKEKPDYSVFVFTFGSPRVGNKNFHQAYNHLVPHHWRVIAAKDPVTKMPLPLFFRHVGQAALLTDGGHLYIDPGLYEMRWLHSTFGNFLGLNELSFKRHVRSTYYEYFSNFCRQRHGVWLEKHMGLWNFKDAGTEDTQLTQDTSLGTSTGTK